MSKSQLTSFSANNLPQLTQNVNFRTSTKYSMQENNSLKL